MICLTETQAEEWEERAAICQYLGGLTREEAEETAWDCLELADQECL